MVEEKYKFEFGGALEDFKGSEIPLNVDPKVIKLYKDGYWSVSIDFPKIIGPLEPNRYCSSFFPLLELIEEAEAIERQRQGKTKSGDDLLIFRRSLQGDRELDICQGVRKLKYLPWDYKAMGVYISASQPIPYYECPECENYEEANPYGEMIAHSIAFIAEAVGGYKAKFYGLKNPNRAIILDQVFDDRT